MAEYIFGDIEILRSDGTPCIVCGDPSGNCVPVDHKPITKIIGLGIFDTIDANQTFTILEDVMYETDITSNQLIKKRRYKKGQVILLSEARREGLVAY